MESAVYGYLFVREEGLSETWRKQHHSEEDFASSKTAFTKAMARFRKFLQEHDKNSGGTPYEEHIMGLYDAAIDYGAHPNPIALARNTSVSIEDDKEIFRYRYLQDEVSEIIRGLVAYFDYGIAIAEINYLSKMQADPGVYNLDSVFLDFCSETNAVAECLNGQAIGFSQRYYNRVNPGIVPGS
ncbi:MULTISPECIES: hypothetical protein [unclassified Pseudomonas]|uniref:hypothetical protein n=1 Tax=unclassified Pseudomonas TaxID=196821 RepID=UPI00235EBC86|nr:MULTISPECIES: hypothetical protein [unclassified Pseudomonas]